MSIESDKKILITLNHLEPKYAENVLKDMKLKTIKYLYVNYLDSKQNYPKAINYLSMELDRRKREENQTEVI